MSAGASDGDLVTNEAILTLMCELFPWARHFLSAPVRNYAAAVFDARPRREACDARDGAMALLHSWIGRVARERGFDDDKVHQFEREIVTFPVMQTGPHLHLLIEPDAFYTHLFSLMGLADRDSRSYISYACSTVKFVESARKGPGWLTLDNQPFNVFGLTRAKMIPYSILARHGGFRFKFESPDYHAEVTPSVMRLREILPRREYHSAAEAIKDANVYLWGRYFDPNVAFLQLDDDDVSDLVAEHLADATSWLYRRLLQNRDLACDILTSVDALEATRWKGWLRNTTHFFWGNDDGRLFPLSFDGAVLRGKNNLVEIPFRAADLIVSLRTRKIVPNLLLMFIVTSILPGVRVLGGSRHTVYYPLMRYALCRALAKHSDNDSLLSCLISDERPGAWGHRVISTVTEPMSLLNAQAKNGVFEIVNHTGAMSLQDACGTLSGFTSDPLWAQLVQSFKSGDLNFFDLRLAFS